MHSQLITSTVWPLTMKAFYSQNAAGIDSFIGISLAWLVSWTTEADGSGFLRWKWFGSGSTKEKIYDVSDPNKWIWLTVPPKDLKLIFGRLKQLVLTGWAGAQLHLIIEITIEVSRSLQVKVESAKKDTLCIKFVLFIS